jgi:hypothetical protein
LWLRNTTLLKLAANQKQRNQRGNSMQPQQIDGLIIVLIIAALLVWDSYRSFNLADKAKSKKKTKKKVIKTKKAAKRVGIFFPPF